MTKHTNNRSGMQKGFLTNTERRIRSEIFLYAWDKYKDDVLMTSMAKILGTSLSNMYKIIKREEDKKEKSNSKKKEVK